MPDILDADAAHALSEKVAFLSGEAAYPRGAGPVRPHETHMSWVFLGAETVHKLKKPVRFAYLDFSTLARREAACRAEFAINQRLAPDVYEAVVPLTRSEAGLALNGNGEVVDWLVRMRRLDTDLTLEVRVARGDIERAHIDGLAAKLVRFYRLAKPVHRNGAAHLAAWRAQIRTDCAVLLKPTLGLPTGLVRSVRAAQLRFIRLRGPLLAERARRIVDAHGDLRPEHIWIGPPVKIIDRLEFDPRLRAIDPLDELAFLDQELRRLGNPAVGARIARRVQTALHDRSPPELYLFYRSCRAMLRARLAIAHMLEPNPRTPEKWPRQARAYLAMAAADARRLEVLLRTPQGR